MNKLPVLSATEMARIEKLAIQDGYEEDVFMEKAGASIVQALDPAWLNQPIYLLVGKGNNGGDAFVVGRILLQQGYIVKALHFYPLEVCSPLCQKKHQAFVEQGGVVLYVSSVKELGNIQLGLLFDGLVGTGFRGAAEGILRDAIMWANQSGLPIVAIDIPSGVPGDSGKVETVAIQAMVTIYLEYPKLGFFLQDGWNYVGKLLKGSFGLPTSYLAKASQEAELLINKPGNITLPLRTQNKYERGHVLIVAGSHTMMGAAILAAQATLRAGAGIVRLFYPQDVIIHANMPPEIICIPLTSIADLWQEQSRARSLLLGPGMGRHDASFAVMRNVLSNVTVPCVIDADALFFLSQYPQTPLPKQALLTPHRGELQRLLKAHAIEGPFLSSCQQLVEKLQTRMLVKGAPNFFFAPHQLPCILPYGNPGMATAGSGDVLSGILAARYAIDRDLAFAACFGCYLHGLAGDIAAENVSVHALIASDLLISLPKAWNKICADFHA